MIIDNQEIAVRCFGYAPTLHDAQLHSSEIVGSTGHIKLLYCDTPDIKSEGKVGEIYAILEIDIVGIVEFTWRLGSESVSDYVLEPKGRYFLMSLRMNDGSISRIKGKAFRYVGCTLVSPEEAARLESARHITILHPSHAPPYN